MSNENRLLCLDALRIGSCFSVFFFHLVSWTQSESFIYEISRYGFIGVYWFFYISGILAINSLSIYGNYFLVRRFLVVFPPFFLIGVLIAIGSFFYQPFKIIDLISHFFFIHPSFFSLFGVNPIFLDGVFWTIFIEVYFYVFIWLYYLIIKKKLTRPRLLFWGTLGVNSIILGLDPSLISVLKVCGLFYFPFFFVGIARWFGDDSLSRLILDLGMLSFYGLIHGIFAFSEVLVFSGVILLFDLILRGRTDGTPKIVAFFSVLTYPLYLCHAFVIETVFSVIDLKYMAFTGSVVLSCALAWSLHIASKKLVKVIFPWAIVFEKKNENTFDGVR